MIKKLRIKFVVINMTLVTTMLVVIFGLIFHFTKVDLETQSINMIHNITKQPYRLTNLDWIGDEIRLPYFVLQIGIDEEIIARGGQYYDLSNDKFLKNLVQEVYQSPKSIGTMGEYNLRYRQVNEAGARYIVFADMSSEIATRDNMIRTCLILGVLSFFVFLIISIKLSKWIVIPIEAAMKQQKQFVSDASHELKTPLTIIMTNAELMQQGGCTESSKVQLLEHIVDTSHKMKSLVEKMLQLARTDTLEETIRFERVDFSKLSMHVVLVFEPIFFEKGIMLETHIEDTIQVKGEADRLREVLEILLDNAYKYSYPYGRTQVTLIGDKADYCLLTVKNEGPELSQQDIDNIFKRFYCMDQSRTVNASFGLGLAIAENIIKQHKGKIWATSKDGINSFMVELRRCP